MHMLRYEKNVRTATISLYNQAVIASMDIQKLKLGQYSIEEFLWQTEHKWRQADRTTYKLEVTWVKGHTNIEGNERVDAEAKLAMKGKSSKAHNLPDYLKEDKLPLSAVAVKQEFEKKLLRR